MIWRFLKAIPKIPPTVFGIGVITFGGHWACMFSMALTYGWHDSLNFLLVAHFISIGIVFHLFPLFVHSHREPFNKNDDYLTIFFILCRNLCVALSFYQSSYSAIEISAIVVFYLSVMDCSLSRFSLNRILIIVTSMSLIMVAASPIHGIFSVGLFIAAFGGQLMSVLLQIVFIDVNRKRYWLSKLNKKLSDISTEKERLRLKKDIHDTLGHELTALNIEVMLAKKLSPKEQIESFSGLSERIKHISHLLKDVIANRHNEHDSTVSEIIHKQVSRVSWLKVRLNIPDEEIRLPKQLQKVLASGVLEALTNCLKHSDAGSVYVDAQVNGEYLTVTIRNNNITSDHKDLSDFSLGLQMLGMDLEKYQGKLTTLIEGDEFVFKMLIPLVIQTSYEDEIISAAEVE